MSATAQSSDAEMEALQKLPCMPHVAGNPFPQQPSILEPDMPQMYDLHNDKMFDALSKRTNFSMRYEQLVLASLLYFFHNALVYTESTIDWIEDRDDPPYLEERRIRGFAARPRPYHVGEIVQHLEGQGSVLRPTNAKASVKTSTFRDRQGVEKGKGGGKGKGGCDSGKDGRGTGAGRTAGPSTTYLFAQELGSVPPPVQCLLRCQAANSDHSGEGAEQEGDMIYWPIDDAWYPGEVGDTDEYDMTSVAYNDGDKEQLNMGTEKYRMVPPTEGGQMEKSWLPATEATVRLYIAHLMVQGTIKAASVQHYLSAIINYHEDMGHDGPAKSRSVTRAVKGISSLQVQTTVAQAVEESRAHIIAVADSVVSVVLHKEKGRRHVHLKRGLTIPAAG
ncbi:hypothetical protein CYMTET_41576 [Cymbomonas tetramitiformis]|uniref:Uncharacterized protein n=1 Tax=Cymbomonas tetramitiformis TaxID=36881 RepID=A0AAE0F2H8_9CHLO|nr:hypothetical protein CYMTET_41576 [Cymbomonas tetramitiformis]